MFYVAFLTFGYISLGFGVWIAMRHKAILRREQEKESEGENQSNEFIPSYQMSQEGTLGGAEEEAIENGDAPQEMAGEQMRLDGAIQSVTETQPTGEVVEQLVGMAEDNESNDLAAIVQQLQEIHHLASEADMHCYVSEDAECFITPDKEQYATTAICRPKVGCKKSTADETAAVNI